MSKKTRFEMIERQKDLIADSLILDMLTTVKKWRDSSDAPELKQMSRDIVQITAYISNLKIELASARATVDEQRRLKLEYAQELNNLIEK